MLSSLNQKRIGYSLILVALLNLSACVSQTPPGPTIYVNTIENATCNFYVWPQGLRLMLWTDIIDSTNHDGASRTGDPIYRQKDFAQAKDGRRLDWQLETTNGITATLQIDTQQPDLADGMLFLVKTAGGSTEIQQLAYDLSSLPLSIESCQRVAEKDPAVSAFIQEAHGQ
ncbi:MAG: hypothetical protein U0175_22340 [Caldilineaceae bacterium]